MGVALWPLFLWRVMYEDTCRPFGIGDQATWTVELVDGEARGFPLDVLIDSSVVIEARPVFASRGSLASTPELSAFWTGAEPVGSRLRVRAGLVADLLNPPFLSMVTGVVRRIQTVTSEMIADEQGVWRPTGPWMLTDVIDSRRRLAPRPRDPAAEQQVGFLISLELLSHRIEPFA